MPGLWDGYWRWPHGPRGAGAPSQRWDNPLANRHAEDGPWGVAPATAILPEIDDARFAVTGVRFWDREAVVTLLAWGQQKAFDEEHNSRPPRSWWAFDSTGRWHIGRLHRELEWNRPQRCAPGTTVTDLSRPEGPPAPPATARVPLGHRRNARRARACTHIQAPAPHTSTPLATAAASGRRNTTRPEHYPAIPAAPVTAPYELSGLIESPGTA